jgi:hypothetical protein
MPRGHHSEGSTGADTRSNSDRVACADRRRPTKANSPSTRRSLHAAGNGQGPGRRNRRRRQRTDSPCAERRKRRPPSERRFRRRRGDSRGRIIPILTQHHAMLQRNLLGRDARKAAGRSGPPEKGGRHRDPQRFEPTPQVEARLVASDPRITFIEFAFRRRLLRRSRRASISSLKKAARTANL